MAISWKPTIHFLEALYKRQFQGKCYISVLIILFLFSEEWMKMTWGLIYFFFWVDVHQIQLFKSQFTERLKLSEGLFHILNCSFK